MRMVFILFLCLAWSLPSAAAGNDERAIRALLTGQQDAWNRGDLDGFMAGYWHSPALRFASGDRISHGWQQTLEGYRQRYPDRAAMGTLAFELLEVHVWGEHAAVFGRWRLERDKDQPHGLFTLLFEKFPEGWRIVADHTS